MLTTEQDFASHLRRTLRESRNGSPELYPDMLLYTRVLPLASIDLSKSQKVLLREIGVSIWNSCNIIPATDNLQQQEQLAYLRAFAYLLLASIIKPSLQKGATTNKLFQNTLTAARECLRANLLDLGQQILESGVIATTYLDDNGGIDGHSQEQKPFMVEYYCLRLLLTWKRDRKDLADYWYSKIITNVSGLQDSDVEKIVDLLHELGSDCLAQNDIQGAIKWFGRTTMLLDQEDFSPFFVKSDLRLTVLHYYAQALSKSSTKADQAQAESTIEQMRTEYGTKLPVILLSLELLCERNDADPNIIASQLRDVINTAHLLESNHRLILHFIYCLHAKNINLAIQCLKSYIINRLMRDGNVEWIEKAIISHLSLCCRSKGENTAIAMKNMEQDFNLYLDNLGIGISTCAAQAAHVLIWKMIHEADSSGQRSLAMSWCQLGLHPLFELSGEINTGKLKRQLVSYHLLVSNLDVARRMLEDMSFVQQNNGNSRYLAYCVAVRSGNDIESQSCLNTITNGQDENDQLLFACTGESIKYGKPFDTARLLQRIFDKHCQSSCPPVDLGALLQCIARNLMQTVVEALTGVQVNNEIALRFCAVFRHAVKLYKPVSNSHGSAQKSKIDVQWFEEQGFETAKAHLQSWPKQCLIDVLEYSNRLGRSDKDFLGEFALANEKRTRRKDNKFVQAVLYASEARRVGPSYTVEDLPQTSYDTKFKPKTSDCRFTLHRNVFNIFSNLHEQYNEDRICTNDEGLQDSQNQLHVLMPLAFEALLFMKANEYLSAEKLTFDEASAIHLLSIANELEIAAATYALLADTVLVFASGDATTCPQVNGLQIPSISAARLLGRIIQALREVHLYHIDQAARWIRCIVQLITEGVEKSMVTQKPNSDKTGRINSDQGLLMLNTVVQQAIDLAESSLQASSSDVDMGTTSIESTPEDTYPEEELEWLATKLFNMAIDLYSVEQENAAKQWATTAIRIAELLKPVTDTNCNGQGLAAVLQERVGKLEPKE